MVYNFQRYPTPNKEKSWFLCNLYSPKSFLSFIIPMIEHNQINLTFQNVTGSKYQHQGQQK